MANTFLWPLYPDVFLKSSCQSLQKKNHCLGFDQDGIKYTDQLEGKGI